jgi:hypothetical protein
LQEVLNWLRNPENESLIEGALDWMRNTGLVLDEDILSLEKQSDLDKVLFWIRQGKPDDNEMAVECKKIDALLPPKKSLGREERAKEIGALDWMRNHGVKPPRRHTHMASQRET